MKSSESSFTNLSHTLFQHFSEFPFFSSRTLFIGNLEKTSTYEDLKRTFFKYGKILKIELKKVGGMDLFSSTFIFLFRCTYSGSLKTKL